MLPVTHWRRRRPARASTRSRTRGSGTASPGSIAPSTSTRRHGTSASSTRAVSISALQVPDRPEAAESVGGTGEGLSSDPPVDRARDLRRRGHVETQPGGGPTSVGDAADADITARRPRKWTDPAGSQVLELGTGSTTEPGGRARPIRRPGRRCGLRRAVGRKAGEQARRSLPRVPRGSGEFSRPVVDSAAVILGATMVVGYACGSGGTGGCSTLVATSGVIARVFQPQVVGLPCRLRGLLLRCRPAFTLLGRRWRRRLVVAFFGVAVPHLCLVLSSRRRSPGRLRVPVNDGLHYESQARTILGTLGRSRAASRFSGINLASGTGDSWSVWLWVRATRWS